MNGSKISSKGYVLVAMVEPQDVGLRFSEWPLHVTLLPWFTATDYGVIEALCREAGEGIAPFLVKVLDREFFGQRRLAVMLIDKHPQLIHLHNELLRRVKDYGWELPGRYTGNQYKPHVTRHHGKDAEGQVFIDAIYIVEKLEQGYRKIVGKVPLK